MYSMKTSKYAIKIGIFKYYMLKSFKNSTFQVGSGYIFTYGYMSILKIAIIDAVYFFTEFNLLFVIRLYLHV